MMNKENKSPDIRNLRKNTTKPRKIPFFNKRDFRIFAAVNGI